MKMYNLCTGGHSVVTTAVLSSAVRPNSPSGKFRYTQGNTNTSTSIFLSTQILKTSQNSPNPPYKGYSFLQVGK